jgi:hypothetical protein
VKICRELQIWLKSKKKSGSLHEDLIMFYSCWTHKFAVRAFLCNSQYIYIVNSTISSTIHTERVVAFPLQQWLGERATVLGYTYFTYHVSSRRRPDRLWGPPTGLWGAISGG